MIWLYMLHICVSDFFGRITHENIDKSKQQQQVQAALCSSNQWHQSNSSTQWRAVVMTGEFPKTAEHVQ